MLLDTSSRLKNSNQRLLEIFFPLVFVLIGLYAAFHHSLWRDEMQGWLVAWRSKSWIDLWKNNAPSGHPILWSALVYLVKDITRTPLSMQLLHWFLGSSAIFCFWRWNPFPMWQKALFTFGYYPFWEYYFVCRFYVLAELLTFVFCSLYPLRHKTYLPSAICIGLLANTHAFSWSLSFAFFITLLVDWCRNPSQRKIYLEKKYWIWDITISFALMLVLCGFSAFSLLQARETVEVISSSLDLRHIFRVIGRIFGGYLLIIPNHNRWIDLLFCGLITFFLVSSTISFLRRSKTALCLFISGISFLFSFNYFIFLGVGSRHYGFYFLILIASLWISLLPSENNFKIKSTFNSYISKKLYLCFPYIFVFSLSIHLAAGLHRSLYDFYVPYSAGEATADYIRERGWSDETMFGTRDVAVATVSGYLDKEIYFPEIEGFGSYAQWKNRVPVERNANVTIDLIDSFFTSYPETKRLLVILSRGSAFRDLKSGDEIVKDNIRIVADKKFERSWIIPERFYLYWAERIDTK